MKFLRKMTAPMLSPILRSMLLPVLILTAGCFLSLGSAHAIVFDKTLTIGSASGGYGDEVSVPISIDDPSGVGGLAFTITYDPDIFNLK